MPRVAAMARFLGLFFRTLIPLVLYASLVSSYAPLSDKSLQNIPGPGSDFDILNGKLLAPILQPRVPGTEGSLKVLTHLVDFFKTSLPDWKLELHNSTSKTPATGNRQVPFVNIIATRDPPGSKPGRVGRLVLTAHYDSLIKPEGFIGAIDSAAPCAMIMHAARSIDKALAHKWKDIESGNAARPAAEKGVQIILFDGEEAFVRWTATDSIYGARALAEAWEQEMYPAMSTFHNRLASIDLFLLLDLLGSKNPRIPSYFMSTHWAYKAMAKLETRLRALEQFKSSPNHPSKRRKDSVGKRAEPVFLPEANKGPSRFTQNYVGDDHVPFLARGVEILHMIPTPFPEVWHNARGVPDDGEHLDMDTVEDWAKLVTAFAAEWMELEGHMEATPRTAFEKRSVEKDKPNPLTSKTELPADNTHAADQGHARNSNHQLRQPSLEHVPDDRSNPTPDALPGPSPKISPKTKAPAASSSPLSTSPKQITGAGLVEYPEIYEIQAICMKPSPGANVQAKILGSEEDQRQHTANPKVKLPSVHQNVTVPRRPAKGKKRQPLKATEKQSARKRASKNKVGNSAVRRSKRAPNPKKLFDGEILRPWKKTTRKIKAGDRTYKDQPDANVSPAPSPFLPKSRKPPADPTYRPGSVEPTTPPTPLPASRRTKKRKAPKQIETPLELLQYDNSTADKRASKKPKKDSVSSGKKPLTARPGFSVPSASSTDSFDCEAFLRAAKPLEQSADPKFRKPQTPRAQVAPKPTRSAPNGAQPANSAAQVPVFLDPSTAGQSWVFWTDVVRPDDSTSGEVQFRNYAATLAPSPATRRLNEAKRAGAQRQWARTRSGFAEVERFPRSELVALPQSPDAEVTARLLRSRSSSPEPDLTRKNVLVAVARRARKVALTRP